MKGRGKPLAVAIGVLAVIAIALVIAVQPQRSRPAVPQGGNLPVAGPAGNDASPAPVRSGEAPAGPGGTPSAPRSSEAPLDLPPGHPPIGAAAEPVVLSVQSWGHACFLLTGGREEALVSVVTDPYDPTFAGYAPLDLRAHFVTISHRHRDHDWRRGVQAFPGQPLRWLEPGAGAARLGEVSLTPIATFHDPQQGAARGPNTVWVIDFGTARAVHLGDLGHLLSPEQVAAIGRVDVLLIPVGGYFTIGPEEARQVVAQLRPRVVIPMHYRTEQTNPEIARRLQPVEAFTRFFPDVEFVDDNTLLLTAGEFRRDQPAIRVLKWKKL